ncbi:MAG TPA: NADH-quinone oxidoreductase subunit L [Ktedonobacteraceae bacterium]|nr:NADH-quinone oxidoreductase subunit L [Ktedonobacteraceae bacterium]
MGLYYDSWLILFSPLFAFVVIVFGTRMWDLFSRPVKATAAQIEEAHEESDIHYMEKEGPHGEEETLEEDEDPQVPYLTMGAKVSGYVAIVIMALACLYSWMLLLNTTGVLSIAPPLPTAGVTIFSYNWFVQSGGLVSYIVAFHIDTLAIAMMTVVTSVSLLVYFYSQGYMQNSAGYARFYAYLTLFTFSMLDIVFAQNFLVIFIGWELVGLSSYLLIGFWINKAARPAEDRPSPATASIEAFIANRVGDVGFIIGIMILFANTGTFDFATLAGSGAHGVAHAFAGNLGLLTLAMILVFCGAIGKSAQFPLYVWLPSAMEGPTPVSALIHAATMVAAGVYMVARTYPLYLAAGPQALLFVAWIGAFTAIFAATVALTQYDLKRILAFSTISQLGYMFVGLGVGGSLYGPGPGMFHLFTHAFFKALLFLCAGSVLHAMHHALHRETQDMRYMGGLARFMPITAVTFLVATLAISGFPLFSGFYSKDSIIGLTFDRGDYGLYIVTLVTAGMTAFYMLRAYILTFAGKGGSFGGLWGGPYRGAAGVAGQPWGRLEGDQGVAHEQEPHESPPTMTIPLILLAIASIVAGYWFGFYGYIWPGAPALNLGDILTDWKTWVGVVVAFIGLGWAYYLYAVVGWAKVGQVVYNNPTLNFLHRVTLHRFYISELYALIIRYGVLGLSHVEAAFDTYVVDGIVNGVAAAVRGAGRDLRHVETGRVQSYMVGFFGGVALLAVLVFVLVTFVK